MSTDRKSKNTFLFHMNHMTLLSSDESSLVRYPCSHGRQADCQPCERYHKNVQEKIDSELLNQIVQDNEEIISEDDLSSRRASSHYRIPLGDYDEYFSNSQIKLPQGLNQSSKETTLDGSTRKLLTYNSTDKNSL